MPVYLVTAGLEVKKRIQGSSPADIGITRCLCVCQVVMVNGGTASTSEVLAAALQGQHRAVLLGEHTYGKGRTQRILPLQDGSTLLVSNALLTSPLHATIDKV